VGKGGKLNNVVKKTQKTVVLQFTQTVPWTLIRSRLTNCDKIAGASVRTLAVASSSMSSMEVWARVVAIFRGQFENVIGI